MKIADKILNDDEFDSFDAKIDAIISAARDLEGIATDALGSFKCTQTPKDYPPDHWSNRLEILLAKAIGEARRDETPPRQ